MSDKLKIKISIGNRVYPLTIKTDEEERIRKAAQRIDSILKSFESLYAVQDKQDLIAMCALQLATECEINKSQGSVDEAPLLERLDSLDQLLTRALQ
ncbi:MAG: cell division protein ZapA [Schleiferiaceae bacterium]|nr:cell division protein ZapA [Schleiferiaceae bacterium]